MDKKLVAEVTFYKGNLVLCLLAEKSEDGVVNTSLDNPNLIGQVIHNTAENLGVSMEALAALNKLKPGSDSLGEIDWFKTADGKASFGWLGGPYAIKQLDNIETSREYLVLQSVLIENNVPEGAKAVIDEQEEDEILANLAS